MSVTLKVMPSCFSKVTPLISNASFKTEEKVKATVETVNKADESTTKVYIKLDRLDETKIVPVYRLSNLNPGRASIVLFDSSQKKYVALKNYTISTRNEVVDRLKSIYGNENIVVK